MKEYIQSISAGLLILLLIVVVVVSYYAIFIVLIVVFSLLMGYIFIRGKHEHNKVTNRDSGR